MTHLDPSSLARYNALNDPHLEGYFSNERIRSHLKAAGLINNHGESIPDGEYRSRLAHRNHCKHIQRVLAESIVNRAIDLERSRQAEIRKQRELITKAAIVHNIKESRRRNGLMSNFLNQPIEIQSSSIDRSLPQSRPRSANPHLPIELGEIERRPRVQSAQYLNEMHENRPTKMLERRLHRGHSAVKRSKSSKDSSFGKNRHSSPKKYPERSKPEQPCEITMVYFGPHTKVDYDHLVFEDIDEIIVMQQHCGGENRLVFKDMLKAGDEFTFVSRRHEDYTFGLSLYVKGLIDSRISTCCEYKHRHGVRLGGDRGHFAIKSVKGSKACIKCRFEKQARLKKLAQSPKDKTDKNSTAISIPIAPSEGTGKTGSPVPIPIRHTSMSNDTYSEDFEDSKKFPTSQRRDSQRSANSTIHSNRSQEKSRFSSPKKTSQISLFNAVPLISPPIQRTPEPETNKSDDESDQGVQVPTKFSRSRKTRNEYESNGEDDYQSSSSPRPSLSNPLAFGDQGDRKSSIGDSTSAQDNDKRLPPNRVYARPIDFNSENVTFEYTITIYPSRTENGEFTPEKNSYIYIRVNEHEEVIRIECVSFQDMDDTNHENGSNDNGGDEVTLCPSFEAGHRKKFQIKVNHRTDEKLQQLTLGYFNTHPSSSQWELEKIVMVNNETKYESTFTCKEPLIRDDSTFVAEKTFQVQPIDSSDDDFGDDQYNIIGRPSGNGENQEAKTKSTSPKNTDPRDTKLNKSDKSPSIVSFKSMHDGDADYRTIFKILDPNNEMKLGSTSPSPKSSHGDLEARSAVNHNGPHLDPLELETLTEADGESARSTQKSSQKGKNTYPITTNESKFKNWRSNVDSDSDDT